MNGNRVLVLLAALVVGAAGLSGCAKTGTTDHTSDPAIGAAAKRIEEISGPAGWTVRSTDPRVIDSNLGTGSSQRKTQKATTFVYLSEKDFEAIGGWESKPFTLANDDEVREACTEFSEWIVAASATLKSPAAELADYWVMDCASFLTGDLVEGEQVWFMEPSTTNPKQAWFLGATGTVKGEQAVLSAIVGVKNYPYATP